MWYYRSTVNEISGILQSYSSKFDVYSVTPKDVPAGLFGPIIISRTNSNKTNDAIPSDVDREFFLSTTIMDESKSPYYKLNIQTCIREHLHPLFILTIVSFGTKRDNGLFNKIHANKWIYFW